MKVSVISPVYNVAPYIEACIESIKQQTFTDFEVLFIDDHSPDNSIEVARRAAEGDSRFRFLTTPHNGGPGLARNLGIEQAQGQYIAFIDSDDAWQPTFLEKLVSQADAHNADLTYCQLQYCGGANDGKVFRNPVLEAGEFSLEKKQYFLRHFVTFSVCFLFRRSFLVENNLRFPLLRNSEDTHFLTCCLLLSERMACVDDPLYIYMIRSNSLSTGKNPNRYKQRLAAAKALRKAYLSYCQQPLYASLQLRRLYATIHWLLFKKGYAQAVIDLLKNL
ncbi:MAG: glycosyltransferase family 2 protein [Bacteroidales bacterium]|nr:glycosyltransferase family 2 protein [Bacteroidales bacterium]